MKLVTNIIIILVLFVISGQSVEAATGINRKINFQGKVVNKGVGQTDGTNVTDNSYRFVFSLFSVASAGTSIWSEVWDTGTTKVVVNNGIFNVALGTYATFPPAVNFNSDSLYLGVNYNSDGEMTPRIQMTAVPYALNAEKVMGLTVTATDGTLSIGNSKTITFGDNFSTAIGVGISLNQSLATTNNVTFAGLSIGGSTSVTGNLSVGGSVAFTNIPISVGTTVLFIDATGKLTKGFMSGGVGTTYAASNGLSMVATNTFGLGGSLNQLTKIDLNSNDLGFYGTGNVAIGTTDFNGKLTIAGTLGDARSISFDNSEIKFRGDGVAHMSIFGPDTGKSFLTIQNTSSDTATGTVGTDLLTILSGGNVGIGTTNPGAKFVVKQGATGGIKISSSGGDNWWRVALDTDPSDNGILSLYRSSDGSAQVYLTSSGNSYLNGGNVGIGMTNPAKKLDVLGDIKLTGTLFVGAGVTGSSGQVLASNGAGSLQWVTAGGVGTTYAAGNGLSMVATNTLGLGGVLSQLTKINLNSNNLGFYGTGYVGIGTTDPESMLHVVSSEQYPAIQLESKYNANGMPQFNFIRSRNGGPVQNWDILGGFNMKGINSAGSVKMFSSFYTYAADATAGQESGEMQFHILMGGSDATVMGLGSDKTIFNEYLFNRNFSVFGNSSANSLYFQGWSGNLGIGTTNPAYKLQVVGDAMVSSRLGIGATGTRAFNVSTDASIGTNLSIGGSVTLTALPVGVGSSVIYIDASGNLVAGTLPSSVDVTNSKTLVFAPEYAGASLSKDGSSTNDGAMTSDSSLNVAGVGWKNYYEWTSTAATLQDYSVLVRVTLPADFDTWETGTCPGATCALQVSYQNGLATTADNFVSFIVNNDADTPATAVCTVGSTASTAWGASGCTSAVLNDGAAPEWDLAGETAVIRIKMGAKNTASALSRIGDIVLRYQSKF